VLTTLDTQPWAQADLEGNAQFIEVGGALYVVSNVRQDNTFVILKSTSFYIGASFTTKATYTFSTPNQEFAPVIAYDPTGQVIHIIGLRNNATNPLLFDLIKFRFDTTTNTLHAPVVLATAERIRSAYDIIVLGNGHKIVAVVLTDPVTPVLSLPGHSLVVFELDVDSNNDAILSTTQLFNSPDRSATNPSSLVTFNSVSLVSPDGILVELYFEQHPRVITFQDQLFTIYLTNRNGSSIWDVSPTEIYAFTGRYSDDRLTVLPDAAGNRYVCQTFYTQLNHPEGIIGNLVLGYLNPPNPWFFHITPGSVLGGSIVQSTLSLAQTQGVKVAYLLEDLLTGQVGGPAYPLQLASVNLGNLGLTNIPGFYNELNFTWLRGSKTPIDDTTDWAIVAEQETTGPTVNTPAYVSGMNVPPVASLIPSSQVVLRGHPFVFDASHYTESDGDNVVFTWSENDPSSLITLIPTQDSQHATLTVPQSVGGTARAFTVAVVDVDTYPSDTVTQIQVAGNLLTVTVPNSFSSGQEIGLFNLQNARFLNGQILTIVTASPTQFTANFTYTNYGPTPDTGEVALLRHPPFNVTNVSIASNVATITCVNTLSSGDVVLLYQLQTATFLNDQVLTVATASGTQFTASYTYVGTYGPAAETGFAIRATQFATASVTVPVNNAPTITFPTNPINAARNSVVNIVPIYTGVTDPDDSTTYIWEQTAGTTVASVGGFTSPSLTILTNGVLVEGETLTFNLTVNDGVNPAVSSNVNVIVAAYVDAYPDTLRVSRSIFMDGSNPAPISERNQSSPPLAWSSLDVSTLYSNFFSVKRNSALSGGDRYLLIAQGSVSVFGGVSPAILLLRKLFTPGSTPILDAVHTEQDYTLVLDASNLLGGPNTLYRYSTAPLINTDNPDTTIPLTSITASMRFNKITCTISYDDVRIIALSGPDGCLLLQVRSSTMSVEGFSELTVESNLLSGADNVLWIRTSNVENLRTGKVLLGTVDTNGDTYETLIDLSHGAILGTWNKSQLINQTVNTGEILFETESTYSGLPTAPVLAAPVVDGHTVSLSWTQEYPNLISNYNLQYSNNGGSSWIPVSIGSGALTFTQLSLNPSAYLFRVQAQNQDGISPFSNVQSCTVT